MFSIKLFFKLSISMRNGLLGTNKFYVKIEATSFPMRTRVTI